LAFSSAVWNLPCPNLEEVSMNLRVISSWAVLEVWANKDFLKIKTLFLGPTQHPLINKKSFLTTP